MAKKPTQQTLFDVESKSKSKFVAVEKAKNTVESGYILNDIGLNAAYYNGTVGERPSSIKILQNFEKLNKKD